MCVSVVLAKPFLYMYIVIATADMNAYANLYSPLGMSAFTENYAGNNSFGANGANANANNGNIGATGTWNTRMLHICILHFCERFILLIF